MILSHDFISYPLAIFYQVHIHLPFYSYQFFDILNLIFSLQNIALIKSAPTYITSHYLTAIPTPTY